MKLKSWVLWLPVVAFLASVVLLFSANSQKDAALVSLKESKQQAADLQAQLDQLKSSIAASQSAELSRLRADNQDLPRLRNEVTQLQDAGVKLQAANDKLTRQLKSTLTAAQQAQAQAQQLAAAENQARATEQAQAQTQAEAERNACINNLRQIDGAKNEWALENNKTDGAVPAEQDLFPYLHLLEGQTFPVCPSGGTYTIGAIGVNPTCSIPGHVLP
jgi:chromosome segregation ATPase